MESAHFSWRVHQNAMKPKTIVEYWIVTIEYPLNEFILCKTKEDKRLLTELILQSKHYSLCSLAEWLIDYIM